jgi:hypothetical protein
MAEEFKHKNVAIVAGVIGGVVFFFGFLGVIINLI